MGKPKDIKPKSDRVKEGIALLQQLRNAGIQEHSLGFLELKTTISEWISGEESWEGKIEFQEYSRVAEVELPRYTNRAAGINFKVKKFF
jgi:hypothetical protein